MDCLQGLKNNWGESIALDLTLQLTGTNMFINEIFVVKQDSYCKAMKNKKKSLLFHHKLDNEIISLNH